MLPSLVAACDAFAFPSVKEGFGLAAMEALAAGRPVTVRELPILREASEDVVTYATDPTSLATRLDAALNGYHPDVDAGRLARGLTWDAAARAHLRFYERHPYPGRCLIDTCGACSVSPTVCQDLSEYRADNRGRNPRIADGERSSGNMYDCRVHPA